MFDVVSIRELVRRKPCEFVRREYVSYRVRLRLKRFNGGRYFYLNKRGTLFWCSCASGRGCLVRVKPLSESSWWERIYLDALILPLSLFLVAVVCIFFLILLMKRGLI